MADTTSRPDAGGNRETDSSGSSSSPGLRGFADRLFLGQFAEDELMPYFEQLETAAAAGDSMVAKTKGYCDEFVFPDRIDQHSLLPPGIVKGMGNIGVLSMVARKECGGIGMSTFNFCRVLEIIGGHCGSTAAMVRLQTCVVLNLLQTYGTPEQQEKYMPAIIAGDQTGALVITEELAGSDISNVRTAAEPDAGGSGFELTGEKRWIANGSSADLFIVLARTPDNSRPGGTVSAFVVPATAKGITIEADSGSKLGLKGITIGSIALDKVRVSDDDLLGDVGDGIAMVDSVTVLDRLAYSATAVGSLKFLLQAMVTQSTTRSQFGKTIGQFEQVKEKIADAAAKLYALEAAVYHTASHFDCHPSRVAKESQMLKLFASESLWSVINDAMDIHGGKGLFNTQPLERVLRNVRHSLNAEGSNDLLKQQIATPPGPVGQAGEGDIGNGKAKWWNAATKMLPTSPAVEVKHEHLRFHSRWLANHIGKFGRHCQAETEDDFNEGFHGAQVADLATNLFLSSCVFSKLSALMVNGTIPEPEKRFAFDTGDLFLHQAKAENIELFDQLKVSLNDRKISVADHWAVAPIQG